MQRDAEEHYVWQGVPADRHGSRGIELTRSAGAPAWGTCCGASPRLHRFEIRDSSGQLLNVQAWCCPHCHRSALSQVELL